MATGFAKRNMPPQPESYEIETAIFAGSGLKNFSGIMEITGLNKKCLQEIYDAFESQHLSWICQDITHGGFRPEGCPMGVWDSIDLANPYRSEDKLSSSDRIWLNHHNPRDYSRFKAGTFQRLLVFHATYRYHRSIVMDWGGDYESLERLLDWIKDFHYLCDHSEIHWDEREGIPWADEKRKRLEAWRASPEGIQRMKEWDEEQALLNAEKEERLRSIEPKKLKRKNRRS